MQDIRAETNPTPDASWSDRCIRWLPWVLSALVIAWFYLSVERYGNDRGQTAVSWLWSAWNGENDFEHGPLFPLIVVGLIMYRFRDLRTLAGEGNRWGLAIVVLGCLFYIAAYRTLQPRVAIGALPFLLWGGALYLWGWRTARLLAFPLFFFWLAIPLPSFQQATVGLQIFSAQMAHYGSSLFGVETILDGTRIASAQGNWEALEIAKGCSGIRSLMALLMISGAWAYVAKMAFWKRMVLFLAAFPLAIIGNTLRVISIFVIAEYGNAEWARGTWHDWSGLLLFYPFSLFLLLCLHSVLEGGLPWRKNGPKATRRVVVRRVGNEPQTPATEP